MEIRGNKHTGVIDLSNRKIRTAAARVLLTAEGGAVDLADSALHGKEEERTRGLSTSTSQP